MTRAFRIVTAGVALVFATSCAVIIHPERKGNSGAPVDTVPLIVDILLFLPGLLPGVIALILDFGTGAIYLSKGTNKPFLGKRGKAKRHKLMVEVVDADGTVLDRRALTVDPPKRGDDSVALTLPDLAAADYAGRDVHLQIATESGEVVSVPAQ